MKLAIFGATGGTGQHLLDQALAAGQRVTAIVRDPARLRQAEHPQLDVVVADAMDADAIGASLTGQDAVVSALGPRPGAGGSVCADGARAIITAMRAAGTRRLIVVTASGHIVDEGDDLLNRVLVKPLLRRLLRDGFADFARTDEAVRASGLDWTIMRPPRLTNGPRHPHRTGRPGHHRPQPRTGVLTMTSHPVPAAGHRRLPRLPPPGRQPPADACAPGAHQARALQHRPRPRMRLLIDHIHLSDRGGAIVADLL